MEMYQTIIKEMYGSTLLEFTFYGMDALISVICTLIALFISFKHFRKTNSSSTRIIFYSILGIMISGTIAEQMLHNNLGEHLSLPELLVVYLPSIFIITATIGFYKLCNAQISH